MAKAAIDQVIRSSGNVFADMGLPDAAELDTKASLYATLNNQPSSRTARIAVEAARFRYHHC